ncbi:hypothetical protein CAEBREN_15628 [Caenorhabditis brenneri]|uniref:Uncharacterized protein n=1 Tax=Caenorhabditis brenneri TaxID=135651 RepID=G0N7G8_CAEBE|nr:hypothetical protein CAEBREN_15628 [Caenorhabditis brenneri]
MKKFAPEGSRPKQDSATGGSSNPLSIRIPGRAMQEKASKKRLFVFGKVFSCKSRGRTESTNNGLNKKVSFMQQKPPSFFARQQDLLCKQLLLRKTRKKDIEDGQEQEEDSDGDDQDQIDEEEEAE